MPVDRRVKTNRLVVAGVLALVVLLTAIYTLLQKTDEFSWQYVTNTVLFSFLGIVNVILILSLLVILFRNLIRLLVERHRNILGSRFRTKLVFTFLGLCLIPALLLFIANFGMTGHAPIDAIAASRNNDIDFVLYDLEHSPYDMAPLRTAGSGVVASNRARLCASSSLSGWRPRAAVNVSFASR